MNFPSTWQMIAVSGGCVAGLAVIAILLIIRRTIYRAKNPQFGTTIKCSNFIAPFVAGHVQPHSSFQLESDPMSLSNKENRGLTYTTYAALHSKPRYSLSSNQSGSLEDGQKSWTVSMKLWYKREKQQLHVTVFRACCSPAPEKFKEFPSTMYIQLSVSQDPERVFQTSLYSNHCTNSIEETFKFSIPRETLDETDLKVVLIESDIDRTRLFRGRTVVELSEFHLDNGKVHYLSRDLDQIRNSKPAIAEAMLSLCYTPTKQRLDVQLFAVRDVCEPQEEFKAFYLKLQVKSGRKVAKEKQTHAATTIEGALTCNYSFGISAKAIECCSITLRLMGSPAHHSGHALLSANCPAPVEPDRVLGEFSVGRFGVANTRGAAADHWRKMTASDGRPVEMWHKLKQVETVTKASAAGKEASFQQDSVDCPSGSDRPLEMK